MKDYSKKQLKYYCDYSDYMLKILAKYKYGVSPCKGDIDFCETTRKDDLTIMRYELSKWQSSGDYSTLSLLRSKYKLREPIKVCNDDICNVNITINNVTNNNDYRAYKIDPAEPIWQLTHDLGFNPNVTTTDLSGQEIFGNIIYIDDATIQITFTTPQSGWVYLS
jgi:hypothetical protein